MQGKPFLLSLSPFSGKTTLGGKNMAEKNERRNETEKREEEMRVSQAEEKEAEEGRVSQASKGETEIRDSHISPEERKEEVVW